MPPSDWITTTRQALPQLLRLATKLKPTFHLADITALDSHFVAEHAVSALLWDVDGTLMPHHDKAVAPKFAATLKALENRIPQAVLSNCGEARLLDLATIFPDIPVLKAYAAGGTIVLRCLHRGEDRWSTGTGPQRRHIPRPEGRLKPVKKPSAELIVLALDELGVEPGARTFMIGDQYFTDIAGANLAGIRSVKVPTFGPKTFPFPIRSFQLIERGIYRILHGRI